MSSPFNCVWGSSISATVTAFNQYGASYTSDLGNGAVILTNPDAPTQLQEVIANRSPTSITIKWFAGINSGGAPVLDYQISMATQTGPGTFGSFTLLAIN